MIIQLFSEKINNKTFYQILIGDNDGIITLHPGNLEKTILAYEDLMARSITEDELLGLMI